jgi:hypothetical protein
LRFGGGAIRCPSLPRRERRAQKRLHGRPFNLALLRERNVAMRLALSRQQLVRIRNLIRPRRIPSRRRFVNTMMNVG